jgi:hypothetical protein
MSRRPVLFALSLLALAATACADATAPQPSAPSVRQLQPSGQAAKNEVDADACRGGYLTGTGRSC